MKGFTSHRLSTTPVRHRHSGRLLFLFVVALTLRAAAHAQDPFHLETSTGADRLRLAAAEFKPAAADPNTSELVHTFDTTLYADLGNAGIFDLVSRAMEPPSRPGTPAEMNLSLWAASPANAGMVAFGNLSAAGGKLSVSGFLDDVRNAQFPQVFAKRYDDAATPENARQIAHRFADEIILRLGGGIPGIAESKVFYVHFTGNGNKEIWEMDYDGANQHAVTELGQISV